MGSEDKGKKPGLMQRVKDSLNKEKVEKTQTLKRKEEEIKNKKKNKIVRKIKREIPSKEPQVVQVKKTKKVKILRKMKRGLRGAEQLTKPQQRYPVYNGVGYVSKKYFVSGDCKYKEETEEYIGPVDFFEIPSKNEPIAIVGRKNGFTKTTLEYESTRIDVQLSLPCCPHDIELCDRFIQGWINKRLRDHWIKTVEFTKKEKAKQEEARMKTYSTYSGWSNGKY